MSCSLTRLAAPAAVALATAQCRRVGANHQLDSSKKSSSLPTFASRASRTCRSASACSIAPSSRRRRSSTSRKRSASIPNLNLSGEGSRARYFQLRGVGELEQYDGAPNPSIGFIVDDIDFSGLGSIAHVVRHRPRRGAARPAGHALRRERARRARSTCARKRRPHDLAADFEAHDRQRRHARARRCRRRARRRRAWASERRCISTRTTVFATTCSSAATTPTAATSSTARGKLAWSPSDARRGRLRRALRRRRQRLRRVGDRQRLSRRTPTIPAATRSARSRAPCACKRSSTHVDLVSITGVADTDAVFSFDADWGNEAYWAPYVYDYVTTQRPRAAHLQPRGARAVEARRDRGRPRRLARRASTRSISKRATITSIVGVYDDPICGLRSVRRSITPSSATTTRPTSRVFGQVRSR